MRGSRGLSMIYVAGFLRSLAVGLLGVNLAVYLSRVGVGATCIGLVIGAGLLGACAATAVVAWGSTRIGYRASLVALSLLAALGGVALTVLPSFPLLLFLVFVGMVNGMGTDRSAAFALERQQAGRFGPFLAPIAAKEVRAAARRGPTTRWRQASALRLLKHSIRIP